MTRPCRTSTRRRAMLKPRETSAGSSPAMTTSRQTDQGNGLNRPLPVDHVSALLERRGKSRESRVEHRTHERRQHLALELIGDEEADVADFLAIGLESPAVLQAGERTLQVAHEDFQIGPVQRHLARKSLLH